MAPKVFWAAAFLLVVVAMAAGQTCTESTDDPVCRKAVGQVCTGNMTRFGATRCPYMCNTCDSVGATTQSVVMQTADVGGGRICSDLVPDCVELGHVVCEPPLEEYGRKYCGISCEFCFNERNETVVEATTTTASEPSMSPLQTTKPPEEYCAEKLDDPLCRHLGQVVCTNDTQFATYKCRFMCEYCTPTNETGVIPMTTPRTPISPVVANGQSCYDDDPKCSDIGKSVCDSPLDQFGRQHCARYCGFCGLNNTYEYCAEQTDEPLCRKLGPMICTNYTEFATYKCRFVCEFCSIHNTGVIPSTTPRTPISPVVANGQSCYDDDPECSDIGKSVCESPLDQFGRQHCARYCGFCGLNKTDEYCFEENDDPLCRQLGQVLCTNYTEFAAIKCRSMCEFCTSTNNSGVIPSTTPRTPITSEVGHTCYDDDQECSDIGKSVCEPPLELFGRQHCARYCGFCVVTTQAPSTSGSQQTTTTSAPVSTSGHQQTTVPIKTSTASVCVNDPDANCDALGLDICKGPLVEFGRLMCPKFCDLCGSIVAPSPLPTAEPEPNFFNDCNTTAEVVFVLDSSSSVGEGNFQMMREFTQNVTMRLKEEYKSLNVTVITFSDNARVAMKLPQTMDIATMLALEANITYDHGGTQTHKALELMMQQFSRDVNNPKVSIVITDGTSFEPHLTAQAAQTAKMNGIVMFVVGIGDDVNPHETSSISSKPDNKYLFQVPDFTALRAIAEQFQAKNCTVPAPPTTTTTTTSAPTTSTTEPTVTITTAATQTIPGAVTNAQNTPSVQPSVTRPTMPHENTEKSTIATAVLTPVATQPTVITEVPSVQTGLIVTNPAITSSTNVGSVQTVVIDKVTLTEKPVTVPNETPAAVTNVVTRSTPTPVITTTEPIPVTTVKEVATTVTAAPPVKTTEETETGTSPSTTTQPAATQPEVTTTSAQPPQTPELSTTPIVTMVETDATTEAKPPTQPPATQAQVTTTSAEPPQTPELTTTPAVTMVVMDATTTAKPSTQVATPPAPTTTAKPQTNAQETTTKPTTPSTAAQPPTTTTQPLTQSTAAPPPTTTNQPPTPSTAAPPPTTTTQPPTQLTAAPPTTTTTKPPTPSTAAPPTTTTTKPPTPSTAAPPITTTTKQPTPSTAAPTTTTTTSASSTTVGTETLKPSTTKPTTQQPSTITTTQSRPPTEQPTTTIAQPVTQQPTTTAHPPTQKPPTTTQSTTQPPPPTSTTTQPTQQPSTTTQKLTEPQAPQATTTTSTQQSTLKSTISTQPPTPSTTTAAATTTKPSTKPPTIPVTASTTKSPIQTPEATTTTTKPPTTPAQTTTTTARPPTPSQAITTTQPPTTSQPTQQPGESTTTLPKSTTTASCVAKVADVVFVVDASGSIGMENFDKVKGFIKQIVSTFDVHPQYTQVALIEYSTNARIEFRLNEHSNMTDLLAAIDKINYSGGGTMTSDALELMRGSGYEGERPAAPDITIVITDGLSKYPPITKIQADRAKAEGITMFSIGIGNQTDQAELTGLASGPQFQFQVGEFGALSKIESVVAHLACGVVLPTNPYTRHTTPMTTTPAGCVDLDDCSGYSKDSCSDYEPYARHHCAKTCGFCETEVERPCKDMITNCDSYGTSMCFDITQYQWVDKNCRKFCGFCGNKTEVLIETSTFPTPVITTEGSCVDVLRCNEYNADLCTNPEFRSFAQKNCRRYCGYCLADIHTVTPYTSGHLTCPAWVLPKECTLEPVHGNCCPVPTCQDGFKLLVKRD